MSSGVFEAELKADHRGRQVVILSAAVFGAAGAAIVLTLPFSWPLRALLMLIWLADVLISLRRMQRGWTACRRLRVSSAGDVRVTGPDGTRQAVRLATGTLVLRRFAWLRYTTRGGEVRAEFLICPSAADPDWHRFQVIWRLARGAFGQRRGA